MHVRRKTTASFTSPQSLDVHHIIPYGEIYGVHPRKFRFGADGQILSYTWTKRGVTWLKDNNLNNDFNFPDVGDTVVPRQFYKLARAGYDEDDALNSGIICSVDLADASKLELNKLLRSPWKGNLPS